MAMMERISYHIEFAEGLRLPHDHFGSAFKIAARLPARPETLRVLCNLCVLCVNPSHKAGEFFAHLGGISGLPHRRPSSHKGHKEHKGHKGLAPLSTLNYQSRPIISWRAAVRLAIIASLRL